MSIMNSAEAARLALDEAAQHLKNVIVIYVEPDRIARPLSFTKRLTLPEADDVQLPFAVGCARAGALPVLDLHALENASERFAAALRSIGADKAPPMVVRVSDRHPAAMTGARVIVPKNPRELAGALRYALRSGEICVVAENPLDAYESCEVPDDWEELYGDALETPHEDFEAALRGEDDVRDEQTAALDIPYVCCSFTNSFGSLGNTDYSSVSIDDQAEARRAVEVLLRKGHRRIAVLLDSIRDHSISELRYRGYCQALGDHGIRLDPALVAETGDFDMAAAYDSVRRLLERKTDFTALFVIADSMAIAAMKALHDGGRRIPEDCSIIAIDGIEMSTYTVPTLTTLIQPQDEMGEEAVRILLDMVEGRAGNRHVRLHTTLRAGGSVCRAN